MLDAVRLDSQFLEGLLDELDPPYDSSPMAYLELADQHEMKTLLASAWQAEGKALSPPVAYEVDMYARRLEGHRQIFASLVAEIPSLLAVKGYELNDLFPKGWVRSGKDLDVRAQNQDSAFDVVRFLEGQGWGTSTVFVRKVEDELCVIAVVKGSSLDPMFMRKEVVEVGCVSFTGDYYGRPPRLAASIDPGLTKPVIHMLGVLEQRLERKLIARDVADAVVLLQNFEESDLRLLHKVLDETALWKQWSDLVYVIDHLGFAPQRSLLPDRARSMRSEVTRRVNAARRALSPSVAARSVLHKVSVLEWQGPFAERAAELVPKVISEQSILNAGLPLLGIPVDRTPAGPSISVRSAGSRTVMHCQLGTYLLIYGREYEPEWLDAVRADLKL